MQERGTAPALSRSGAAPGESRRLIVAGLVAAAVVASDQLTKTWAVDRLSRGSIHIWGSLDLELQFNTGSAFSLAQGKAPILATVAVLLVGVLVVVVRRMPSNGLAASLGLIIGGALGNLADRIFRHHHGGVIDFVALHWWPTFNVADSCIVIGSLLTVLLFWCSPHLRAPS
jgi:signal peptidase II